MYTDTVSPILNPDAEDERARDLLALGLNGLQLVIVDLQALPGDAQLELHFINDLHVEDIFNLVSADPGIVSQIFRISGGHRLPAGPGTGQVRCTAVAEHESQSLLLTVSPIGDYSSYTLELDFNPALIDPYFSTLSFKFRPGCFTNDCASPWQPGTARRPSPDIDYLARDYESFRHLLNNAMAERVPGWQISSEADLDQVLIDLFAASADELADYQDRVMNEAYLGTARKRVSLARHARLMDYHIHHGNQASTCLALQLDAGSVQFRLNEELICWSGHDDTSQATEPDHAQIVFASQQTQLSLADRTLFDPRFNEFHLYTWSHARPALPAGSTTADLIPVQGTALALQGLINDGSLMQLLLEEVGNPLTGQPAGINPDKRQLLRLLPEAELITDPVTATDVIRVHWQSQDQLRFNYSFSSRCAAGMVDNLSVFHGNLLPVYEGLPVSAHFHEPGTILPIDTDVDKHRYYERWILNDQPQGVRCQLPLGPAAYQPTPPGGEVAPRSTVAVTVELPGGAVEIWDEVISLVHSDDSAEQGDHYIVETDEQFNSLLRTGNGINGRWLADDAILHANYQIGGGVAGNVGARTITGFSPLSGVLLNSLTAVWNPFDVIDGRAAEPVSQILRAVPEAYRARQLRAITLDDYIRRAEEVPGVSRAVASYVWPGSWRAVRLVIDPENAVELSADLLSDLSAHLEAVRLIGEDLEIRPPRFVPLSIEIVLCLHNDVWPADVRYILEQEFSDSYTPDGRHGFFHPDVWTFGQALYRSQVAGRLQSITGVAHAIEIRMRRFNEPTPGISEPEVLEMGFDEIVEVHNDPDHMERGSILFTLQGGRQ